MNRGPKYGHPRAYTRYCLQCPQPAHFLVIRWRPTFCCFPGALDKTSRGLPCRSKSVPSSTHSPELALANLRTPSRTHPTPVPKPDHNHQGLLPKCIVDRRRRIETDPNRTCCPARHSPVSAQTFSGVLTRSGHGPGFRLIVARQEHLFQTTETRPNPSRYPKRLPAIPRPPVIPQDDPVVRHLHELVLATE